MGALFLRMVIVSLKTVAEFLDWEKDPDHIVSEAACLFFFDLLSTHRDTETDKLINNAVAMVAPHISFIARRTQDAKSTHAHQLLKAAFLCSSCDDLHKFQTVLLANGTFLYHLHHVLKYSSSSDVHPNQEIVIATVAASEEARRTLGRIFPAPLLNVLDSASYFEKLSGVSYEDPLVEGHDNTIRDNMALCVVFRSLRTNWKDFWAKLDEQQTAYDFIWSQAMKAEVTESLQRELDDVKAREGTSGDAANFDHAVKTAWSMLGLVLGAIISVFADRHYTRFETQAVWWAQILKVVLGLALTLAVRVALKAPLTAAFGANSVGDGIRYFAVVLMAGTLWPMTFGWFSLMGRKK